MARISVDDSLLRDPRVVRLARACGWSRRETIGALLDVWAVCYDRVSPSLELADIDIAADREGFGELMIGAGLAAVDSGRVRVSGAAGRIDYLTTAAQSGKRGGNRKSMNSKGSPKPYKGGASDPLGWCYPPDRVPDSVPDPVPDSPPVPDPEGEVRPRKRGAPRLRSVLLPADWVPRRDEESMAAASGVSAEAEAAKMRDWAAAKGETARDWDARFRNWIRRAAGDGKRMAPRAGPVSVLAKKYEEALAKESAEAARNAKGDEDDDF